MMSRNREDAKAQSFFSLKPVFPQKREFRLDAPNRSFPRRKRGRSMTVQKISLAPSRLCVEFQKSGFFA